MIYSCKKTESLQGDLQISKKLKIKKVDYKFVHSQSGLISGATSEKKETLVFDRI